ncbi:selenophosphate synthase [Alteromonadaceae bacterium Bs31]|nr:selenophosphate synthase [Alteromonadaceae bacterium Bs31]
MSIKLTEYSHGAGCGCKIAPGVLEKIVATHSLFDDPKLVVGNSTKDDAAAYDLGNGELILSTTDFFMPIVDEPFDFGRIAATNAISDIYAMGGTPIMAIAILGWPLDKLGPEVAAQVIEGGRAVCAEAGMQLAGGHSIDAPEPIFGLAVTGRVKKSQLKTNASAKAGSLLYLSKPLGVGILSTAQKQKKLAEEHQFIARDCMCQLNSVGAVLAKEAGVNAITDVTGFGLAGHLLEMCQGSGLAARLNFSTLPILPWVMEYMQQGCIPGGTGRNFASYTDNISPLQEHQKNLLCDPQTSGGLLVAVEPAASERVEAILEQGKCEFAKIGVLRQQEQGVKTLHVLP